MPAVIPKVSEVKNLQDLSKVIVLPLIAVSYVLQSGLSIGFGSWVYFVPAEATSTGMILGTLVIFSLKAIFISALAVLLYFVLFYAHAWLVCYRVNFLQCVALLFIALGFYGVLTEGAVGPLSIIHHSWFYTAFVVGFFLLQATAQFEEHGLPPLFSIRDRW